MHKPKKRYTFCNKKKSIKQKNINILYIGEMDHKHLQNKIDNLDEQQQTKLAKYIYKLEKKAAYQRRAQGKTN